jgi:hypothetical protein
MIRKLLLPILILFLVFSTTKVLASGFTLQSIGQSTVGGKQISKWSYTGSSPILKGEAVAASTVTISIDGTSATATADSSGNWTYNPGALIDGDHAIILTNNDSTIKFTLTTGATNLSADATATGSGTATGSALPVTGVSFPTIFLLLGGASLMLIARKLAKQN